MKPTSSSTSGSIWIWGPLYFDLMRSNLVICCTFGFSTVEKRAVLGRDCDTVENAETATLPVESAINANPSFIIQRYLRKGSEVQGGERRGVSRRVRG